VTCDCFINSFIHISVSLTSSRIHKFKSEDCFEEARVHNTVLPLITNIRKLTALSKNFNTVGIP